MEIADRAAFESNIFDQKVDLEEIDFRHSSYKASSDRPVEEFVNTKRLTTVIIDCRQLVRECLVRGFHDLCTRGIVENFASVKEWLEHRPVADKDTLVLLSTGGSSPAMLKEDWSRIVAEVGHSVPLVLLAEEEEAPYVVDAIKDGVRGYIPTSLPLSVAIEAIELVRAGGIFIPATSFLPNSSVASSADGTAGRAVFTGRQAEVIAALRKGTSNKVIAYNLKMAESTVKVHVRTIMRKMKARNRTHVAFLLAQQDSACW